VLEGCHAPGIKLNGYRVFRDWTAGACSGGRPLAARRPADWSRRRAQSDAAWLADILRQRGSSLPVIGVDGMEIGKRAVDERVLAATVIQPLGVGHALRVFRDLASGASETGLIPNDGNILLAPKSYPPLEALRARATSAP
jgi:hypothetical protein